MTSTALWLNFCILNALHKRIGLVWCDILPLISALYIDNNIDMHVVSDRGTLPAASGLPRTAPHSGSAAARTRSASSWSRRPLSPAWTRLRAATSCCSPMLPRCAGAAAASRWRGGGSGHLDFQGTAASTPVVHSCSPVTLLPRHGERKTPRYTSSQKFLLFIASISRVRLRSLRSGCLFTNNVNSQQTAAE